MNAYLSLPLTSSLQNVAGNLMRIGFPRKFLTHPGFGLRLNVVSILVPSQECQRGKDMKNNRRGEGYPAPFRACQTAS